MSVVTLRVSSGDHVPSADLALDWTGRAEDPVKTNLRKLIPTGLSEIAPMNFFALAVAVYAADKAVIRSDALDGWTRDIDIHVPQIGSLPSEGASVGIEQLLGHLTGDRWSVDFYGDNELRHRFPDHQQQGPSDGAQVALFSGGLDSFAYFAQNAGKSNLHFVAHYDRSGLPLLQKNLFRRHSTGEGQELHQFSASIERTGALANVGELEPSTRSRSLLFVAAAAMASSAVGSGVVTVPENGFISLNPPLAPARRGTLTTRTTHPLTLQQLNSVFDELGLALKVENPFLFKTKGDITRIAYENSSGVNSVFETVSCSRARARVASPVHYGNCGYCYPCLVRRSGLHACGITDLTLYRDDPCASLFMLQNESGEDFRAVVSRIRRPFTVHDLTSSVSLPRKSDYVGLLSVVERSRNELMNMIESRLSDEVRDALKWPSS